MSSTHARARMTAPKVQNSGQLAAGARAVAPMAIGVAPFGLAIGAAASAADMSTGAALAGTFVLAGAAQLTAIQMLDAGVTPIVIVASALMINARILLYSASLAPWFRDSSLPARLVLALPVIDQLHFTCLPRFEQRDLDLPGRVAFYGGAASVLVGTWITTNWSAILIGARLPEGAGLHVAAPVALAGLLAKSVGDGHARVAATVGAVIAVVAVGAPFRSAVLLAAAAGIVAGTAVRHRGDRRPERS